MQIRNPRLAGRAPAPWVPAILLALSIVAHAAGASASRTISGASFLTWNDNVTNADRETDTVAGLEF
jgi:hypothetical protein